MILNFVIIIAIVGGLFFAANRYLGTLDQVEDDFVDEEENDISINYLADEVSDYFAGITKRRYDDENLTRDELQKKEKQIETLRSAITNSSNGDKNSKHILKGYIKDLISSEKYDVLGENRDRVLPLYAPNRLNNVNDKFEILLYLYTKKYGTSGFDHLMTEFDFTRPFKDETTGETRYCVTRELLNSAYELVVLEGESSLGKVKFSDEDYLEILSQKIFEKRFGLGAVDMLRETNVDEIDGGVSGVPADLMVENSDTNKDKPYSFESIWIVYHGLNIQMECLSFETQNELVRVVENLYKYEAAYTLSKSTGYVVNTMIDGSRIVVVRPPFADSYGFFCRKFDSAPGVLPSEIIKDKNRAIPIALMHWFIKGQRNIGITGSQGTGKTTMLKSMIRFIDPELTLRLQELQFELNLRYAYAHRNIVTFQETATISAQDGLNLQKKTNGSVNIIGEVANAIQAGHIIQTAMVASLFAMFTHHAKTAEDWVNAIADNLLQIGLYQDKKDAVRAAAGVLNIDCHLTNIRGNRHIERITEVIPSSSVPYPSQEQIDQAQKNYAEKNYDIQKNAWIDAPEYFHRVTDPELFTTREICRWEPIPEEPGKGQFVLVNLPSERTIEDIANKLSDEDEKRFRADLDWCKRLSDGEESEEINEWIAQVLAY